MDPDVEFFIKKFNVSRETIEKLNKYKDFLVSSNKLLNLIGKTTENQIFTRHFVDSAQIYDLIEDKSEIIDLMKVSVTNCYSLRQNGRTEIQLETVRQSWIITA